MWAHQASALQFLVERQERAFHVWRASGWRDLAAHADYLRFRDEWQQLRAKVR